MQPDTDEFLANVVFLFSKKKKTLLLRPESFLYIFETVRIFFSVLWAYLSKMDLKKESLGGCRSILSLLIGWRQILNASLRSIVRKGRILSQLKK